MIGTALSLNSGSNSSLQGFFFLNITGTKTLGSRTENGLRIYLNAAADH